jgi:acyl dehydratase
MESNSKGVGTRAVTAATIRAFAQLTGDRSRIHIDPEFAQASGFSGPIAHGLLTGALALGALTRHQPNAVGVGNGDELMTHYALRLSRVVESGDELSFRWVNAPSQAGERNLAYVDTGYEVVNQREDVVASGHVSLCSQGAAYLRERPKARVALLRDADGLHAGAPEMYYAEDIVACGPRGTVTLPTQTQASVDNFVVQVDECNPLYSGGAGAVPPMLIFCLGFSAFLEALLRVAMPATGSAGHVADEWQVHRLVAPGEKIRMIHQPLDCKRTQSRPELAVVRFALNFLDTNHELVQQGTVKMMIPSRPDR